MDIYTKDAINNKLTKKQDTLVSGTNIKTINGNSLLGSGNVEISGTGTQGDKLVRICIDNIKDDASVIGNYNSLVFVGFRDLINTALESMGLNLDTLSANWATLMAGENASNIWVGICSFLSQGKCFGCFYNVNNDESFPTLSAIIDNNYLGYILLNNTTPEGHVVFNDETTLKAAFANSTMELDE